VLVVGNMALVHLLLVGLQHVHLVLVMIISNRWGRVRTWFVEVDLRTLVLHLLLDQTTHFIRVIIRELGREHEATIAIGDKWLLIVADLVEGELHLCRYNEIVPIFDSHLGQTFRLSSNGLLAFNVDIHFFFLNKLSQFEVLHLGKDGLHQDLKSLVRANLNIKRFVQFVVEFRRFNSYMEAQVPSFFLSIGPFWVLSRSLMINHRIHLLNLSGLLLVQNLAMAGHHVLKVLGEPTGHQALVNNAIVILKTLVIVSLPII
jgi:hypothetical protein